MDTRTKLYQYFAIYREASSRSLKNKNRALTRLLYPKHYMHLTA